VLQPAGRAACAARGEALLLAPCRGPTRRVAAVYPVLRPVWPVVTRIRYGLEYSIAVTDQAAMTM
jgi:hypothetical protein